MSTQDLLQYMTVREAAKRLGISVSSVYIRISKGKLSAEKHGVNHFIHRDAVERMAGLRR